MQLENKIAIVTGSGRNIGEGIAKRYADEGAKVAVVDKLGDRTETVAAFLVGLSRRGLSARSQARYLSALRGLYKFLLRERRLPGRIPRAGKAPPLNAMPGQASRRLTSAQYSTAAASFSAFGTR